MDDCPIEICEICYRTNAFGVLFVQCDKDYHAMVEKAECEKEKRRERRLELASRIRDSKRDLKFLRSIAVNGGENESKDRKENLRNLSKTNTRKIFHRWSPDAISRILQKTIKKQEKEGP